MPRPAYPLRIGRAYYDVTGLNRTLVAGQAYDVTVGTTNSSPMGLPIGFTTTPYPDGELVFLSGPFFHDTVFKTVLRVSPQQSSGELGFDTTENP